MGGPLRRGLENIFDLQDQVTASVVGAIAPKLEAGRDRARNAKPTESLDAYDYYLRGMASFHAIYGGSKDAVSEALQLFYRAIELDPEFASAHGMAAWCYVLRKNYGWMTRWRRGNRRSRAPGAAGGTAGQGRCRCAVHRWVRACPCRRLSRRRCGPDRSRTGP